jgi:hypothetical protein
MHPCFDINVFGTNSIEYIGFSDIALSINDDQFIFNVY